MLLSRGCTPESHRTEKIDKTDKTHELPPPTVQRLKEISHAYRGSVNQADIAKLGTQIAHEISGDAADDAAQRNPLLAIPFTAPAGDAAAEKLADSSFALVYGRIAMTHHGQVGLPKDPLPSGDLAAALERGRAARSTYVLWGAVESQAAATEGSAPHATKAAQSLTIKIGSVEDGTVVWSKSYPAPAADPMKIAAEVTANVPALEDD
jgi:hypothetical protein